MPEIRVSEVYSAELQAIADREGRDLQDVVTEALQSYVSENVEPSLTSLQVERLRQGLAQANAGNFLSGEEVDTFFATWEQDLRSR